MGGRNTEETEKSALSAYNLIPSMTYFKVTVSNKTDEPERNIKFMLKYQINLFIETGFLTSKSLSQF